MLKLNTAAMFLLASLIMAASMPGWAEDKDIRKLSQHFIEPNEEISPWIFYPEDNIETLTTTDHRGILKILAGEKREDIKGVLEEPINVADYPLPWEFHMGFWQPEAKAGYNYAIGVNLAVTFSDPSTWPEDRTQMPPNTHSLQLFVAHIGNYGEPYLDGIPQLRFSEHNYGDPAPEVYLIYGRGDLAVNTQGDWEIPYAWTGYQPPGIRPVIACHLFPLVLGEAWRSG